MHQLLSFISNRLLTQNSLKLIVVQAETQTDQVDCCTCWSLPPGLLSVKDVSMSLSLLFTICSSWIHVFCSFCLIVFSCFFLWLFLYVFFFQPLLFFHLLCPVVRGRSSRPNLLCCVRGTGGSDRKVFWQRLLACPSCSFSPRPSLGGQGFWGVWETDFKAVKRQSPLAW